MSFNFNVTIGSNLFEIKIDTQAKYGYFEHLTEGDNCAGGMWFDEDMQLMDYDGVFALPSDVKNSLIMFGMIDKEQADLY